LNVGCFKNFDVHFYGQAANKQGGVQQHKLDTPPSNVSKKGSVFFAHMKGENSENVHSTTLRYKNNQHISAHSISATKGATQRHVLIKRQTTTVVDGEIW
jgi:hypothetical protein